jgi:hypothetical protein
MERTTTPPPPPTEDELERFRQEWQKELQQQREQRQRHGDSATQRQADAHKVAVAAKASPSVPAARVEAGSGIGTSSSVSKSKQPESPHKAYKPTSPKSLKNGSANPGQAMSRPEHELREGGSKPKAKTPITSSPLLSSTSAVSTSSTTASTSTSASKPLHPKPLQSSNGKKPLYQSQSSVQSVKTTQAVEQYANAVELEQMGRLNEALQAYRGAYRLDGQSCSLFLGSKVNDHVTEKLIRFDISLWPCLVERYSPSREVLPRLGDGPRIRPPGKPGRSGADGP